MFLPFCLQRGQRIRERKHEQERQMFNAVSNYDVRYDFDPDDKTMDVACSQEQGSQRIRERI